MRFLILFAAIFAMNALAQQPSPTKIQGVIAEIEAQRLIAQTRAAQCAGEFADAQEQSKAKDAEIERLKKLCGEKCEPKKEEPNK